MNTFIDGEYTVTQLESGHIIRALTPTESIQDTWLIAVGAFFDRFGALKIPILASSDAGIQAMVKDAQVRKWIDLHRPDLPSMLDYIIAVGFAVDKATILGTPAAPTELP